MSDFNMSEINREKPIHFVGIGGISMSGLAQICLKEGYTVTGSDITPTKITDKLSSLGAKVTIGQRSENCVGAGLVVYTAAIREDNPELVYARENGIKAIERSVFLGAVMKNYKNCICVSGTHGKTSTTSMMSYVLLENELDPTIMLGGELDKIGGNFMLGHSEFLLAESCEYHCSFLEFSPRYAIITNVDKDHLDYFKTFENIKKAFCAFANIPDKDGYVIVCGDDKNALECAKGARASVITYGIGAKNDIHPDSLWYEDSKGRFLVTVDKKQYLCAMSVCGEHNVKNALACVACGYAMGLDMEKVISGISQFVLVHRRYEKKGEINGALIIDDYAHHPTEIDCTLKTAQQAAKGKVIVAFQPHTYTRTYTLIDEFEKAFDRADTVLLADIYAAREADTGLISSKDVADRLNKRGIRAVYAKTAENIAEIIRKEAKEGDIVLTVGAGDIYKVADLLTEN